jgi:hypothetical protein
LYLLQSEWKKRSKSHRPQVCPSPTREPTSRPHQRFFPGVRRCTNLFSRNLSACDFCCGGGACFRGKETAGHHRSFPPGVNSPNQPPKKHSLAIRAVVSLRFGDVPLGKLKKGLHSQHMAPFKAKEGRDRRNFLRKVAKRTGLTRGIALLFTRSVQPSLLSLFAYKLVRGAGKRVAAIEEIFCERLPNVLV